MNTVDEIRKIEREISDINRRLIGVRENVATLKAEDVSIVDAGDYFTGVNVETALQESGMVGRVLNGSTLRAVVLTIAEAGGVVTASLSSSVGTDIIFKFSSGFTTVDVTAPKTVVVTHGTDINPTMNYLYVLASDPTTLVRSVVGFPAVEYCAIAKIFCQSAASAGADGCYKEHVYADDIHDTEHGHVAAIDHWIRTNWAHWESGVAPTFSGTGTNTIGYASTAGEVGQLHDKVFPLFADPAEVYAINDPDTAYRKITNIADLLKDSTGAVLKNRTYGLVFWGVLNDNGESNIFCNLPSGSEIGETNARQDKNKYISYGIPTEFRGVGFLIYRLIIKNNNDNTWTLYTGGTGDDLRGQIPATSAGSTTAIGINFPDGVAGFNWFNAADITKLASLDLAAITPGNNRVLSLPDKNLTPAEAGANSDITSMSGITGPISTPTNLSTKTTAAWNKSIGAGGGYADWATMIADMPDLIAHAVTVTIQKGTTLTEICELKNKHGITAAGVITVTTERYYPTAGAIPTADSATATTLRDAALAAEAYGNDYFNGNWIFIVNGTGTDNGFVPITDYVDATGDVVVAAWPGTQPDATSRYIIVGALIDGGGSRNYCFDFRNDSLAITFRGIGIKDADAYGFYFRGCAEINMHYCGACGCDRSGILAYWTEAFYGAYCGIVNNNTDNAVTFGGALIWNTDLGILFHCALSDNNQQGISVRRGAVAEAVNCIGDGNGAWGAYAEHAGQIQFTGVECSGAAGNHSDPGTAGAAASDQAAAY